MLEMSGLVDLDDNSALYFSNQYFFGVQDGQTFDQLPTVDGFLEAINFEVTLPAGGVLTNFFVDGSDAFTTEVAGREHSGADASVLTGWTWAGLSGNLLDFNKIELCIQLNSVFDCGFFCCKK